MKLQLTCLIAKQIKNLTAKNLTKRGVAYFYVLTDDTSDNGHVEQLSLSLLFVNNNEINEEFLFRSTYFHHWGSTSGFHINKCVAS